MVFSGVGKTRTEIQRALDLGVGFLNLESEQEFEKIDQLAAGRPKICTELGIRFNPNVDAKTHPYISTGLRDHKFGVSADQAFELYHRPTRVPWGALSMHIGSQIMDLGCVDEALSEALQLATRLRSRGIRLRVLDIGGGLGVRYDQPHSIPNFRDFGRLVGPLIQKWKALQGPDAEVHCELGRALTAMAGILVTRVIGTKQGDTKSFVIVDASMTELLRPALYQAEHPIEAVRTTSSRQIFDVVGPVCESSDVLGCSIELPVDLVEDDILVIHGCGAYGRSMSSEYNLRRLPPELWTE
jgi:diaminopimelate decarboxylase